MTLSDEDSGSHHSMDTNDTSIDPMEYEKLGASHNEFNDIVIEIIFRFMSETLTLAEFRAAFPEFQNFPDSMVQQRIDWALAECDPEVWGDKRSIGAGFLAAHYITLSPRGEDMRLKKNKGAPTSFYEIQFDRWKLKLAGGARIAAIKSEIAAITSKLR